ncbi:MAG: hypothetical protein KGV56_04085 [Gammaproteobacteria bacterium]|nr:hypothetical protein [Gammaproteobacteria bacterium]
MSKTTLNLKLDTCLKEDFAERCRREGRSVSLVLRELMKNYLGRNNRDDNATSDDYDEEFYAKIDKALQSPISDMTEEELFARLRG